MMKDLKVCPSCDSKTLQTKLSQMYVDYECGCYSCGGSGQQYLSDGEFTGCYCAYDVGPYFMCDICSTCGSVEMNRSRKVTSRRARAHLRLLVMKGERSIIERLESLFLDGMTWCNRSEWHIDHIKPIKAFLDEGEVDFNIINNPSNLQPLWAKDNLLKGARYININNKGV